MQPYRIQLEDISAVAAGGVATIHCPIGPRYRKITLVYGNSAAANGNAPANPQAIIGEIQVLLNSRIQRQITGQRLDAINAINGPQYGIQSYNSAANGGGRIHQTIYFREDWRKRTLDADALAWQTGYLKRATNTPTFQIKVALNAGITPVLTAFADVDDFDSGAPSGIMKYLTHDFNANGNSVLVTGLPVTEAYSVLSLMDTSDGKTVTNARLTHKGKELVNLAVNEQATLLKSLDMNPAAGAYHIVFDEDDNLQDTFAPSDTPNLKVDLSAASAGTLTVIAQRFGLAEGFN